VPGDPPGGRPIRMTHSGTWDEVLRVLRDPIFALLFAIFLAFLSSRRIRRLIRFTCFLSAVVILIWLAAHDTSSAHVEIAVVAAATRVVLTLIVALFIVAIIAIAALLVMYFKTQPVPSSLPAGRSAWRGRSSSIEHEFPSLMASVLQESSLGDTAEGDIAKRVILEEGDSLNGNFERTALLLGDLFDGLDDVDNPVQVCVEFVRIYFSGLSAHSAEIKKAHEECGKSIGHIANALERTSYGVDTPLKDMSRKNWFPTSGQWAAVMQDSDFTLPYLALRIICFKAVWRAVAMIIYKPFACVLLLAQLDDH
jgi:hypothetical protein